MFNDLMNNRIRQGNQLHGYMVTNKLMNITERCPIWARCCPILNLMNKDYL